MFCELYQGQNTMQPVDFGDMPKPQPSVSSLSTYTDNPSTISTSIPEISIPLFVGLTLNYNPLNASKSEPGSEVGLGWTLFKGGSISREINGFVDEIFQSTASPYYEKNEFDDIYYYDLPEFSGKFRIERNISLNTFELINLTPTNNIKIEYSKASNDATLVINSFLITDNRGFKYYFDNFSESAVYGSIYSSRDMAGTVYKSSFHLTKIEDNNNILLTSFSYQKEPKFIGDKFLYDMSKLITITSGNSWIAKISYTYHENLVHTKNDPYSLDKLSLFDGSLNIIDEYTFHYLPISVMPPSPPDNHPKRFLDKISRGTGIQQEQTLFLYYPYQSGIAVSNVLKRIIYPNKSATEYIYESGEVYFKRDAAYAESLMQGWNVSDPVVQTFTSATLLEFNTEQNLTYNFTVPGDLNKKKYFTLFPSAKYKILPGPIDPETGFPSIPPPLTDENKLRFTIRRGDEIIRSNILAEPINLFDFPGVYSLEISVGYFEATGIITSSELSLKPPPYRNYNVSNGNFRIKKINSYKTHTDIEPARQLNYSYNDFTQANTSSGFYFNSMILYKNIEVSEGTTNGYTRYYYKTPNDYPAFPYVHKGENVQFWPNYNVARSGLLEKAEVYNANHQILSSTSYSYNFEEVGTTDYHLYLGYYSRPAWIKSVKQTSNVHPTAGAGSLTSVSETFYSSANFKVASTKETQPDGTITESFYKYVSDKNNQRLIAANMTGVLLETEKKVNGKTVITTETKYDNPVNYFPSAIVSLNANDQSRKTLVRYDVYDDRGNLVQYTGNIDPLTSIGNPTTIIYGYNQTLPIAKIIGAKLSDIGSLADDIIAKSNTENSLSEETDLMNSLDQFRNLPSLDGFLITTYTYDPEIGITSVTAPNGQRELYKYDNNRRRIETIDTNGNILQETKYHNK